MATVVTSPGDGRDRRDPSATTTTDSSPAAPRVRQPFPAATAWLTPVADAPRLDPQTLAVSAALADDRARRVANLHAFAAPVYEADASTPRHRVAVTLEGFDGWGDNILSHHDVPIPDGARWAPGSNGKLIVVDPDTDQVFDLWRVGRDAEGWSAAWGGVYPLSGDGSSRSPAYQGPYRVPASTPLSRGTGSAVSTLAGLIRLHEVAAGEIPHALAFSSDLACGPLNTGPFRWPATTTDGTRFVEPCLPEGARIQLDPSIDLGATLGIGPGELAVGRALQTYGAYLTDNGGARMAFMFELPKPTDADPYAEVGLTGDYYAFTRLPWDRLRVLATWDGS